MGKAKKWLANYWYHYKWHTIVGAFFVALITFLLVQSLTHSAPQFQILYAGPKNLEIPTKNEMSAAFAQLQGAVEDEDDRVGLANIYLLTDEQAKDVLMTPFEASNLQTNRQQFNTYTATGECLIYLLDPAWYAQLKDADALLPLADVLGATPQNAQDAYSVRFKDTAFAQHFSETFEELPDDTLLCMRRFSTAMSLSSQKKQEARYQTELAYFKKLLQFGQ